MASDTSKAQGMAAANHGASADAGKKAPAKGKPVKAKAAKAELTEKDVPRGGKRRAADGLVMMAMALVTLALCFGLVVQAGVGLWLAVTVSAAFYMGLLTLHALARRHEQLDELRGEVERLKRDVARFGGDNVQASPPVVAIGPGSAGAAQMAAPGVRDRAADAVQSETSEGSMFGQPGSMPVARQRPGPGTGVSEPAPSRSAAAPVPEVVRAPQPAGRRAPIGASEAPLAGSVPPPADDMARNAAPLGGINRVPRNPDAGYTGRVRVDVTSASGGPLPVAPMQPGSGSSDAFSYRPGDVSVDAPASPREADVEMIQGLIKKLADEVNAADAGKLAPVRGHDSGQHAIDQSIAALRDTAGSMRRDRSEPFASDVRPAPDRDRDAVATARSHVRQDVPERGAAAAMDDEDIDVEAMLRRAEPIARMTSLPPPLPAAAAHAARPAEPAPPRADPVDRSRDRATFDADTAREILEIEAARRNAALEASAAQVPDDDGVETTGIGDWDDDQPANEDHAALAAAAEARLEGVAAAIGAGRVDVFLEPILDLEKQQPRHYEVSVRLRADDGRELLIDHEAEETFASGALPLLDSVRLRRTASVARRLEERSKPGAVFATFSGQSLASDEFLTEFADTYDAQETLAGQLVLTFSQADVRRFRSPHWTMLQEMRDLGFCFALRAMTDLDMDFEQLVSAGFRFVKLDASVFLEGMPAPDVMLPAADICKHLAAEGMTLIVEAIDDDQRRARVFGFGVLFGQGHLFGGPRLMKAAAVAGEKSAAA